MNLEDIRKEIDQVDNELVKNFLKRMDISKKVAKEKEKTGSPVVNTAREREILSRVSDMAGEDMEVYARVLYNTLFDVSKAYQTRILSKENETTRRIKSAAENTPKLFPQRGRVACQGVEGAYSQIACDKLFSAPDIMYFKNFEGVFRAVETGLCEYGVLPIENSSYGSVSKVYDLMKDYNFSIIRSIKIHIDHNLLAKA
jgi:chorismate mutase/prephenate dehydratase